MLFPWDRDPAYWHPQPPLLHSRIQDRAEPSTLREARGTMGWQPPAQSRRAQASRPVDSAMTGKLDLKLHSTAEDADPATDESRRFETLRRAVAAILTVVDEPQRPGLLETPERVARMLLELTEPDDFEMTWFPNAGYDQMIVEDSIPFFSTCEHHMVPFFGHAKVAYVPRERIVGLSKLARTVDHFARGLQTQERITNSIADFLRDELEPQGVGVRLSAEHLCMSMRGVKKPGTRTITTALRGVFKEGPTRD